MQKIYCKRVSIRYLIFFIVCILGSWNELFAQQGNIVKTDNTGFVGMDSLWKAKEPGILLNVDKITSTAAVSILPGDLLYKTPTPNLSNTLYGLLPGLTVSQGSGEPGYDEATLRIRGIGTYNDPAPIIYVDGFETNFSYFQYLSSSEIESISVLKDAAALAPFGMKGANGVIWVTTKHGSIGKPHVQLRIRSGMQLPVHINKPLKSFDYARLYNEAISNDQGMVWSPAYTDDQLQAYKSGTGTDVDWYDEVLDNYAPYSTINALFSGGDSVATYFVMLGYMNDQGLYQVKTDDLHSNASLNGFTIRTNLDFKAFKIFEGKVNIGGRIENRKYPNYNGLKLWSNLADYPSNIYPVKNEDGSWTGTTIFPDNPVASINGLGYTSTHDRTLQANFSLKESLDFITPGLYMDEGVSFNTWTRGSYNVTKNYVRMINGVQQTTDKNTNPSVYDDHGTNQWYWQQFTGTLGYHRQFGIHDVSMAVNYLQYSYNVDANQNGLAGVNTDYGYQNVGGRLHYVYKDRYVAEFGFAFSGSDNYAKGNRWGFYPALSAAWILSKEPFFNAGSHVNLLKLRASVGKTGYDEFSGGRYFYQLYYANSGSYPTGTGSLSWHDGLKQAYVPNPDIFAEQSLKYNVGVDAKVFNNLAVTLDVFMDKRSGIITQDNSLMAVFGTAPPYANIGKVTNKGFEVSVEWSNHRGKLGYHIGGTVAYNSNNIDYMAEIPPVSLEASKTGRPVNSIFGYVADGFYDVDDFNQDGELKNTFPQPTFGAVQPGDIKYRDQNGDKRIDEADLVQVGMTYFPKLTYSLSAGADYKGFDIWILFQGAAGRTVNLLDMGSQAIPFVDNRNVYAIAEGRWAYYPDQGIDTRSTATYPRLTTVANNNNYINSTFWMKNGDFLRLRNVEVGYNIPSRVTKNIGLSNVRVFLEGINMVTWSSLLKQYNVDPETFTGYPALKSYNMGITVDF